MLCSMRRLLLVYCLGHSRDVDAELGELSTRYDHIDDEFFLLGVDISTIYAECRAYRSLSLGTGLVCSSTIDAQDKAFLDTNVHSPDCSIF